MSKWTAGEEEMGGETQMREMSRLHGREERQDLKWQES